METGSRETNTTNIQVMIGSMLQYWPVCDRKCLWANVYNPLFVPAHCQSV